MDDEVKYWRVSFDQVDDIWPKVKDILAKALERGRLWDIDSARHLLRSGDWQLWVVWHGEAVVDGIAVTIIRSYPLSKVCYLIVCTGEGRENWEHHVEAIERWAKGYGCDRIKAISRPGWEKVLKSYRKTHVELEKEL